MEALRQLLVGPEQAQIEQLQRRLEDPRQRTEDIGNVLPEAIEHSVGQDDKFTSALTPIVEKVVRVSVKRDMKTFVDALYPIMGPAIRKAIAEAFKTMVQSLNNALEQSFSLQGLKWRIESLRSGKPFAEVILLHSLVYRVEQVFLIHGETGLLIEHVSAGAEAVQDADLVSGMLTAIQDFVRDSFRVNSDQALNAIQVGEFSVWVEQGPLAILAVAIRGTAQEGLRVVFRKALENIHREKDTVLAGFNGDPIDFESARHYLAGCLMVHYKSKKRRMSPMLFLIPAAIALIVGVWCVWVARGHNQLADFTEKLQAAPGIVITAVEKNNGQYHITGLRDPLAKDPAAILSQTELKPEKVRYHFEPYENLQPEFVLKRAKKTLRPPGSTALTLRDGTLVALGSAPYQWVASARKLATAVSGVSRFDDSGLVIAELLALKAPDSVTLSLNNGVLTARGSAPHRWIVRTRVNARRIPGVWMYTDTDLTSVDQVEQDNTFH